MRSQAKNVLLRLAAVRTNVKVGANFHVGPGSKLWAPRMLDIGNDVYVGSRVTVEVDGTIGDGSMIANNVGIVGRRDHDMRDLGKPIRRSRWVGDFPDDLSLSTSIGADVWIGFGAVVLSGVNVGDSAVIAAGSLITADVEPNAIVAGQPARQIGARFDSDELRRHWDGLRACGVRLKESRGDFA